MKNLILLAFFFVTTICSAQIELEGNKEGVYRVKEDTQEWALSGITAEFEAIKYVDKFPQAINDPGTPILVKQDKKVLKLKPVFKELVEVKKNFIIYNNSTEAINYLETKETKEEFSYLVLIIVASLILIIISTILFKKAKKHSLSIIFFAAIVAALSFALAFVNIELFFPFLLVLGVFSAFAVIAFISFVATGQTKNAYIALGVYYFLIVIEIILLCIFN